MESMWTSLNKIEKTNFLIKYYILSFTPQTLITMEHNTIHNKQAYTYIYNISNIYNYFYLWIKNNLLYSHIEVL